MARTPERVPVPPAGPDEEPTWTIAEVAEEFGVTHRTIRYYEDKGLISPERRGTVRVYRTRDRVRLGLVLRGRRLGFPLDEIATIVDMYDQTPGETGQLRYLLGQIGDRRADLQQRLADIQAALSELDALEQRCASRLAGLGDPGHAQETAPDGTPHVARGEAPNGTSALRTAAQGDHRPTDRLRPAGRSVDDEQ